MLVCQFRHFPAEFTGLQSSAFRNQPSVDSPSAAVPLYRGLALRSMEPPSRCRYRTARRGAADAATVSGLGGRGQLTEAAEQPARRGRDLINRSVERFLIEPRGGPVAADFSHELQCCGSNLFVGGQTVRATQCLDASTHVCHLLTECREVTHRFPTGGGHPDNCQRALRPSGLPLGAF